MRERDIDAVELRKCLSYDADTGVFTWLRAKGRQRAGALAGVRLNTGYLSIRFDGVRYPAHRLAWILSYGAPAVGEIDHKDGDRQAALYLLPVPKRLLACFVRAEDRAYFSRAVPVVMVRKEPATGLVYVTDPARGHTYPVQQAALCRGWALTRAQLNDAHAAYLAAKRRLHAGCTI